MPLALLEEPWAQGKRILMLEPRRLAARAVERMAQTLGESVGRNGRLSNEDGHPCFTGAASKS